MKSNYFFLILFCVILCTCSNSNDDIYISSTFNILSDGTGFEVTELSFQNQSDSSLVNYTFGSSYDDSIEKLMDMNNNELEFNIEPNGEYFNYIVQFPYPIEPGQQIILKAFSPKEEFARLEDETWVYNIDRTFGPTIIYSPIIKLPVNSEIVYSNIKPIKQYQDNNHLILEFNQKVPKNEYFHCTIKYKITSK